MIPVGGQRRKVGAGRHFTDRIGFGDLIVMCAPVVVAEVFIANGPSRKEVSVGAGSSGSVLYLGDLCVGRRML